MLTYADVCIQVVSVLDGYNVCIFAYGQTGSGKTHTMEGSEAMRGVNYRCLHLKHVKNRTNYTSAAKHTAITKAHVTEVSEAMGD